MTTKSTQKVGTSAKVRAKTLDAKAVVAAMEGRIEPVRTGVLYQLGLLLSAVVVLVLPLVYLSLIAGVAYLTISTR